MTATEPSGCDWAPAPAAPRATPGTVDVWRAELDGASATYAALLSEDERLRVGRFARTEHGVRWSAARGILRALLGRYLELDPRVLRFELGAQGKPALAGVDTELHFNMSHAKGLALYAFAFGCEVGVDVEQADRRANAIPIARRIFGDAEAHRLEALDPDRLQREFLRLWVRHEAVVKCLGVGIGAYRAAPAPVPAPSVIELDLGADALGALAVERAGTAVRCWQAPT